MKAPVNSCLGMTDSSGMCLYGTLIKVKSQKGAECSFFSFFFNKGGSSGTNIKKKGIHYSTKQDGQCQRVITSGWRRAMKLVESSLGNCIRAVNMNIAISQTAYSKNYNVSVAILP